MVYRRRYLSGQEATTVVISEGAVTSDKIVDKAVTQPKIDDNAITSDKIQDGEVKSEDIGAQEVETSDIKDAAVTGPKIAENTIPESKLSFSPSTRPLTPGVDTVEIQNLKVTAGKLAADAVETAKVKDGNITAAKLAGDAVETAKIKDANVTGPKIATSSIDNTHIKADAVRGTEIQDGAVGVNKLGTDAVETVKIKNANVTLPKLEADILSKALYGRQIFYDDFIGAVIPETWSLNGHVGGVVDPSPNSIASLITNNVINEFFRMDWNDVIDVAMNSGRGLATFRVKTNQTTNEHIFIGIFNDDDNYVGFRLNTAVDNNWYAVTRQAAAETIQDTSVVVAAAHKKFQIRYPTVGGDIEFYIDDVLRGFLSTNKFTLSGHVCLKVQTLENAVKSIDADVVLVAQDRVLP